MSDLAKPLVQRLDALGQRRLQLRLRATVCWNWPAISPCAAITVSSRGSGSAVPARRRPAQRKRHDRGGHDQRGSEDKVSEIHGFPCVPLTGERRYAYFPPMTIRPILTAPDPRLKAVSKPVDKVDAEIRRLIDDMVESMYEADGIGLAAVQIGVPKRIIVMDLDQKDGKKNPRAFINPKILWASEELATFEEGCLSVPEIWDDVERPARIKAEYLDRDGKKQVLEADGLLATCLQHEMDHLEGVLFIDHLSKLKRSMALQGKLCQKAEAQLQGDAG